ncbi:Restriction of telomere capping protein 5 [Podila humilis]|nr:Restriction of telomere capping protein 5 [Podila humilis]
MGIVNSLLKDNDAVIGIPGNHSSGSGISTSNATTANTNTNHGSTNSHAHHLRGASEILQQSWVSSKLYKDLSSKFSELELLSLRQVLAHLKEDQESLQAEESASAVAANESGDAPSSSTDAPADSPQQPNAAPRSVPGITEETFIKHLGIPPEHSKAGKLLFRSFFNLSIYPDPRPVPRLDHDHAITPPNLVLRDFIKPLALYCHKTDNDILLGVTPLKAIFESFAEYTSPEDTLAGTLLKTAVTADDFSNSTDTQDTLPLEGQESLKRSKTMEDSLRDLTLQSNFEWNPEDDDFAIHGPKVKALDLVEVIGGVLWLAQKIALDSPEGPNALQDNISSPRQIANMIGNSNIARASYMSRSKRAIDIVEHMIQYGRTSAQLQEPVDLTTEMIDYELFTRYVSRNAPNLFEVLSQYFYSIFLIGNTMRRTKVSQSSNADVAASASGPSLATSSPTRAGTGAMVLPGFSPIPALESPSDILTAEKLVLMSWFLPLKKTSPRLTNLYSGSRHGFSMNQFELHVCKYPAPTVFLLLVERQKTATPTMSRRKSMSFGTTRHRASASATSPTFNIPYGAEGRRSSFDKLVGKGPTTPAAPGSALTTIVDGVTTTVEPKDDRYLPDSQRNSVEFSSDQVKPRRPIKERMILGAYVTETWKVSKTGWGSDSFALFELSPCFEVFPARKNTTKTSLANTSVSARSMPGTGRNLGSHGATSPKATAVTNRHYAHFLKNVGVGFGGAESESCMLYMDDNLQYGNFRQDFAGGNVYTSAGGVRQSGFDVEFEIVECEVWGLGGAEAKARQKKEWEFEAREANRRASIHLRKDGDQDIDRDLLEMAGILEPDRGHRHARRQSAV